MPQLNVDKIVNKNDSGAPSFTYGATVAAGYAISCPSGVVVTGVVTCTSYTGDGNSLSNLTFANASKAFALNKVMGFDEYRA